MQPRLVIFDMDGTLADSFPWFLRVMDSVADRFGLRRVGPDDLDMLRRLDSRGILKWLGVPRWKLPLIASHMRRLKSQNIGEIGLFPGVERMLRELAGSGIRLAIVSSDNEANTRRTLGPSNAEVIEFYACGASLFGKSAKFGHVLRRAGVRAADALAIGDEVRDAEAAAKSGIPFGAVTWGYAHIDALRATSPALVFSSIDDIAPTLTP